VKIPPPFSPDAALSPPSLLMPRSLSQRLLLPACLSPCLHALALISGQPSALLPVELQRCSPSPRSAQLEAHLLASPPSLSLRCPFARPPSSFPLPHHRAPLLLHRRPQKLRARPAPCAAPLRLLDLARPVPRSRPSSPPARAHPLPSPGIFPARISSLGTRLAARLQAVALPCA
jgi:hypothetical protein